MTTRRILCVDDHQDTCEMMAACLTLLGYEVATAGGWQEAMAMAQRQTFDLYLIDVHLADGDGYDLCRKIRALHPTAPIILSTGDDSARVKEEAAALNVAAVLMKPLDIGQLTEIVRSILGTPLSGADIRY